MNLIELINNFFCGSSNHKKEINYLNSRIESLTQTLSESISPVPIFFEMQGLTKPYNIVTIKDCLVADLEYCTFNLDKWKTVLTDVYNELKPKETYTKNIFDCDDFALVFSGVLAYSAFIAGFITQPAFAIAWSNNHAFNLFIDNENKLYIYEPQTNNIMIYSEAIKQKKYSVKKVWFMS